MQRMKLVYYVALGSAVLWCSALVAAPLFALWSADLSEPLYRLFGLVCHQADERSFHVAGHKLATCMRCSTIALGFLAGLVSMRLVGQRSRPSTVTWLFVLTLSPLVLDVGGSLLGLHESNAWTRALTGGWFGIGLAWLTIFAVPRFFEQPAPMSAWAVRVIAVGLAVAPLIACAARKKGRANKQTLEQLQTPPPTAAPPVLVEEPRAEPKPDVIITRVGCSSDADCKGNRICTNGECVAPQASPAPVAAGCAKDTDCKGSRVCVQGQCKTPTATCEGCAAKCSEYRTKCNEGTVKDCFRAGACMCQCKLDHGGCGADKEELKRCISSNQAKAAGR